MLGIGKKKSNERPGDYETRPVKFVKLSETSWQIVWADEK